MAYRNEDEEERGENRARPSARCSLENPARRHLIVGAASGVALWALFGFSNGGSRASSDSSSRSAAGRSNEGDSGTFSATQPCKLYPEETQGPYYRNVDLFRRDITEGRPGVRLTLAMQVLRESGCDPIRGVDVEIWHANARGLYSEAGTFLRGTQTTDGNGAVRFETIYPGWYPGRTTHVHFKVHLPGGSVVTSQMYFPEEITAAVYATAPYDARPHKDTSNAADPIYAANAPPLLNVSRGESGYLGNATITVQA
jgi:protocatechuate 3,4-dioxygenase beta subunit